MSPMRKTLVIAGLLLGAFFVANMQTADAGCYYRSYRSVYPRPCYTYVDPCYRTFYTPSYYCAPQTYGFYGYNLCW